MYTKAFWKAAFERAVGAFSAPLAKQVVGLGGAAALASLVASVVKANVGPEGPGLTEKVAEPSTPEHVS
jgi:hypothetical protein